MKLEIWKHFKKDMFIYIGIGVLFSFLSAINIFYFQKLLDGFGGILDRSNLFIYALTLIIIPILAYIEKKPRTQLDNGIFFYFKELALEKMSQIAYVEYLKIGSGSLLQRVEAGANAGRNIHVHFYGRLLRDLLPETCFSLFFIALIDIKLIPIILIGYILVYVITRVLLRFLQTVKERSLISEEIMNSTLIRGITEMVTFRVNKRYKKEISKYHDTAISTTNDLTKLTLIHEFFFGFFALLVALIKLVIVILTFTHVLTLSLGGLVALITYIDRVYTPVAIFNVIFVQYHLDKVTYTRLTEFFDLPNDNGLVRDGEPLDEMTSISIRDLNLVIENKEILRDFQLELKTNRVYGVIGESGAGKSSLVKLILGLFKPTKGEIFVNQRSLGEYNLNAYYDHVFYLSQDAPIFQGTLRENIVFDKSVTDTKIKQALENCQLRSFYDSLENGLDTTIGEKGANISGGEKQRIAFARLYFSNATLIVIDEATSALDEATETKLLSEIYPLFKDKIVIMITHRPKNLTFVDEIIELNKV
ncbi:ATP-binding cassette domain-containing protein [Enterococcus sp. DIV0876]|uniref:ATP-binding cassette domain-containing protein n=1 Tax=Enterococcus sp. DIV0876 TaxID=2774633 RepID=UPI003D2F9FF8